MTYKQILQARAKKNSSPRVINKVSAYGVILGPVMTEKSHKAQESWNKYTFKVHKDANKNDVKLAIKYIYNVDVVKINIVNSKYKRRQQRGLVRRAFKKAVVTLGKKDKIERGN